MCQSKTKGAAQITDIDGHLVSCRMDGVVRTWTQDGVLLESLVADDKAIRALTKIGRFMVTVGTYDGRLKVWDWDNEQWLFDLQEDHGYVFSKFTTAYGRLAVTSWKPDIHTVQVWDIDEIHKAGLRCVST